MPTVSEPILWRFTCDVAAATGIPAEDARTIGGHYVDSHLSGHDSHGVFFLARLADAMINNYVPWEERKVVRDNPCMTIIDGKGAHGIIALTKAVEIAVDKARGRDLRMCLPAASRAHRSSWRLSTADCRTRHARHGLA